MTLLEAGLVCAASYIFFWALMFGMRMLCERYLRRFIWGNPRIEEIDEQE